jgi:hypothetical protein
MDRALRSPKGRALFRETKAILSVGAPCRSSSSQSQPRITRHIDELRSVMGGYVVKASPAPAKRCWRNATLV